jgi:hypothetical protein
MVKQFISWLRDLEQLFEQFADDLLKMKAAEIQECEDVDIVTGDRPDYIEDGFGSRWKRECPVCHKKTMQVMRPGDARCSNPECDNN